jgi:hypothetical protein
MTWSNIVAREEAASLFDRTILLAALSLGSFMMPDGARAQTMPPIRSADLNKKAIFWPRDFAAERTLIFVAFRRSQQSNIDGWVAGMNLKAKGAPLWFEVPMIDDPGSIGRWFIDNGMRTGIPKAADRARVVTVYGKKATMMSAMNLPNEMQVHAIVVDKAGKIIIRVSGDYSLQGAAVLREAMSKGPSDGKLP